MGETGTPEVPFKFVLERAKRLDEAALTLIYRWCLPVVYRYVAARVGHIQHAEDISAETMLAILRGIGETRADDELAFTGWALSIARHKVADHFRWLKRHPQMPLARSDTESPSSWGVDNSAPLEAVAEQADPLTVMIAREEWAEVVAALNRLTDEQREVVVYRCILGYTTEEITRLLDKRPDAIRALQHRALTSLARFLRVGRGRGEAGGGAGGAGGAGGFGGGGTEEYGP